MGELQAEPGSRGGNLELPVDGRVIRMLDQQVLRSRIDSLEQEFAVAVARGPGEASIACQRREDGSGDGMTFRVGHAARDDRSSVHAELHALQAFRWNEDVSEIGTQMSRAARAHIVPAGFLQIEDEVSRGAGDRFDLERAGRIGGIPHRWRADRRRVRVNSRAREGIALGAHHGAGDPGGGREHDPRLAGRRSQGLEFRRQKALAAGAQLFLIAHGAVAQLEAAVPVGDRGPARLPGGLGGRGWSPNATTQISTPSTGCPLGSTIHPAIRERRARVKVPRSWRPSPLGTAIVFAGRGASSGPPMCSVKRPGGRSAIRNRPLGIGRRAEGPQDGLDVEERLRRLQLDEGARKGARCRGSRTRPEAVRPRSRTRRIGGWLAGANGTDASRVAGANPARLAVTA